MGKKLMDANVVLVIPNSRWNGKREWKLLPQYAPILSALLRDQCGFSIVDCNGRNISEKECALKIREIRPDMILTSGMSCEYHEQPHRVAAIAKDVDQDIITIVGGVYPTVLGEECLADKNIDYIFMGHAEERVVDFLEVILSGEFEKLCAFPGIGYTRDGIHINSMTRHISTVKTLSKPDYSLLDLTPYLINDTTDFQFHSKIPAASVFTSFGCPYNCVFCATRTISGRGIAFRPIDDVLEEVSFLIETYGIKRLLFLDDSLLARRKHIEELLHAFMVQKYDLIWNAATVSPWHLDSDLLELMKKSGCFQLTLAIESGSQRVLDEIIHKPLRLEIVEPVVRKCKEVGIDVAGSFVIGFPGETWEEIRQTFHLADQLDLDLAHFHMATPLPKTDLYYLAKEQNLLPDQFSFTDPKYFGFAEPFIETEEFSKFELKVLRAFEWDRINFKSPEKVKKVAQMYNTTIEALNGFRRQTRRRLGIFCDR